MIEKIEVTQIEANLLTAQLKRKFPLIKAGKGNGKNIG